MTVIGYTFNADCYCPTCTRQAFPDGNLDAHYEDADCPIDGEGNPIHPIFSTDENPKEGVHCGHCGDEIAEPWTDDDDDGEKIVGYSCGEFLCPSCTPEDVKLASLDMRDSSAMPFYEGETTEEGVKCEKCGAVILRAVKRLAKRVRLGAELPVSEDRAWHKASVAQNKWLEDQEEMSARNVRRMLRHGE